MDDRMINRLVLNLRYVLVHLYLDNPGVGEFKWDQIYDNLPNLNGFDGNQKWHISKDTFKTNLSKIIKYASLPPYNMKIYQNGGYFKVLNIEDVIDAYHRCQKLIPPPFKKPKIFKELWGGSGIVGDEIKRES